MGDKELFQKPITVFQQNVNDLLKEDSSKDVVEDLIKLQLYKTAEANEKMLPLVELYNLLGVEKFMQVMDLLESKTIKVPPKQSFKETIQIALCYYYKNVKGYSWEQIKELLNDPEFKSVKFGIKIQQLQRYMEYYGALRKEREEKENGRK